MARIHPVLLRREQKGPDWGAATGCKSEAIGVRGGQVQLWVEGEGRLGPRHLHVVVVRHLHQCYSRPAATHLHRLCVTWQLLVMQKGQVMVVLGRVRIITCHLSFQLLI